VGGRQRSAGAAIVRILLDRGADASIASNAGETVAHWAQKYNNPSVLAMLKLETKAG
jgi:ankyrin repeat protein